MRKKKRSEKKFEILRKNADIYISKNTAEFLSKSNYNFKICLPSLFKAMQLLNEIFINCFFIEKAKFIFDLNFLT